MSSDRLPLRGTFLIALVVVAQLGEASGLGFSRLPLSPKKNVLGSYSEYDVFKPFSNPALLGEQKKQWEAGVASQLVAGGIDRQWALAGSWKKQERQDRSYGLAILASGLLPESLREIDADGAVTGVEVTSVAYHLGVSGAYSMNALTYGLGLGYASESLSLSGPASLSGTYGPSSVMLDAGLLVSLYRFILGVAYQHRFGQEENLISLGGASQPYSEIVKRVGAELMISTWRATAANPCAAAGLSLSVHRVLDVHMGMFLPLGAAEGEGSAVRTGLTARIRTISIDYALSLPIRGGLGTNHHMAIVWGKAP